MRELHAAGCPGAAAGAVDASPAAGGGSGLATDGPPAPLHGSFHCAAPLRHTAT